MNVLAVMKTIPASEVQFRDRRTGTGRRRRTSHTHRSRRISRLKAGTQANEPEAQSKEPGNHTDVQHVFHDFTPIEMVTDRPVTALACTNDFDEVYGAA